MTVEVDQVDEAASDATDIPAPMSPARRPAGWWTRAGAFGIDVLVGLALLAVLLLVGWSAPPQGWLWWVCMAFAGATVTAVVVNRVLLPTVTGWTLGRCVFGIAVVGRDGDPVGPWRLLLRDLAHVLDTVPFLLGWLWPLLDARGRTFADLLLRTEVHDVDGPRPDRRRLAAAVIAGAAVLGVAASALGYGVVHRHQRAVDRARAQIAEEGPKIVVDLLSYTAKSASEDFAQAQTLVTDDYRPVLISQQDTVRKSGLVDNDYWVSNGAVLSSSEDRAAMLLMLQGQRGVPPNQRFVTASVRCEFEKTGPDQWKLSNLTVLAPPRSGVTSQSQEPAAPGDAPAPSTKAPPKPSQPPAKPNGGGR